MASSDHIGRVGALAVALGIGYAVAASSGVAWAAPDTSSTAGSSQRSEGAAGKPAAPHRERGPKRSTDTSNNDSGNDATTAVRDGATQEDPPASARRDRRATRPNAPQRVTSDAGREADAISEADDTTTPPTPRRLVRETLPATADEPAARDHPAFATVLRSLFTPKAPVQQPQTPESPAASALLWTTLASSRRQDTDRTDRPDTGWTTGIWRTMPTDAPPASAPGLPAGPVVVGQDGTLYQVTTDATGTRVSVLDSDGHVVTTTGYLPGGLSSSVRSTAVRPDGTLLVSTTSGGFRNRSTISAVDSDGTVTTVARLVGGAGGLTVGADGAVYTQTSITVPFIPYGTYAYRYVRISQTGAVRSLPPDTTLRLTDDGTAYLLSTGFGSSTLRAFDANGKSTAIWLPYSAAQLSSPVLGPDGSLYLAADVRFFGTQTTRLYTVSGTESTVRTLPGSAGATVVTADGVYLETHTYAGFKDNGVDGTTYISKLTPSAIDTLDPIDGRISTLTGFQVTPAGAVYVPLVDPTADTTTVAVFDTGGQRSTVVLPGTLPADPGFVQAIGTGSHADEFGYVRYSAGGADHVAVLTGDGTVARTVDLPAGATLDGPVIFGPDGTPYAVVRYRADTRPPATLATQVLSLSTGTLTPPLPGGRNPNYVDIQFAPDGTGYLLTEAGSSSSITITGFTALGATGASVTVAHPVLPNVGGPVVFAPDGTGYLVDYGTGGGAVYALSSSGVSKVLDLSYDASTYYYAVVIGADDTPYLTTGSVGDNSTTVTPITPVLET